MFLGKRCGGFYDKIIANVNQVCPFCGEGRAITLDHFLPKAEYPFLVVTPENLVPSCRDCNMEKGDEKPTCNEEVPLHPYYDDIDSVWLEANIDYSKADNLDFEFVNNLDKTVEPLLFKRIDVHMRVHDLKANFSTHATSAINSKKRIHLQDAKQGVNRLHNELERELKSFEAEDVNSWRSALYRGLIRSIDKYVEWLLHLPSRYH